MMKFSLRRAGFPAKCDNPDTPLPVTACQQGLAELTRERLDLPVPPSAYNMRQLAMIEEYLLRGAPYGLDESKLALEHGKNRFDDKQDQALCLDSLAGAAKKGFIAGPFPLGSIQAPKIVGIFTREQESSQKKRYAKHHPMGLQPSPLSLLSDPFLSTQVHLGLQSTSIRRLFQRCPAHQTGHRLAYDQPGLHPGCGRTYPG